ncbi:MAG: class II aldolase/adducin family protein [Desulfurococcaceae archaeon]
MYEEIKTAMADVMSYLEERWLNYGRSGNVSVYVRETGHVLMTPSGLHKAKLRPEDIIVMTLDGKVIEGTLPPTVEYPLHTSIYKVYDYINAVIHAHTIYATALAAVREPLPPVIEEIVIYVGGEVRVADYAHFGSKELAENVVKALEGRKAALLANHGVVACGKNLEEALEILVLVERAAQVYILSKLIGKPYLIPEESLKLQMELFKSRLRK